MSQAKASVAGTCADGILTVSILIDQIREPDESYAVRDQVIALIDKTQPAHLVLDFSQVRFMGSVGMLAFLGIRRRLAGGRIVLCQLSEVLRQMFTVCRLIGAGPDSVAPFEAESTSAAATARLKAVS